MEKTIDLSISVEDWEGQNLVRCSGNFIVNSIPLVRKRFEEVESGQNEHTALDFTLVTDFDAAAMCILLNFNKRMVQKNGILSVIGPNEKVKEMFARVGFDADVRIFDTTDHFTRSISLS